MKQNKPLPLFGVGPIYVVSILVLTVIGIALHLIGYLDSGKVEAIKTPFAIIGILLIFAGCYIWYASAIKAKLQNKLKQNQLVTTGAYTYVRNPVYVSFAMAFTGFSLLFCNLWLLILPILFYVILSLIVINTEEVWLREKYGEEYNEYFKRVNRCIPWFKRK